MTDESAQVVLALVRDLMFSSKIMAEGRAQGIAVQVVRQPGQLAEAPESPRLMVDLAMPGAIAAAAIWQEQTGGEAIGFVSHVDEATIQSANDAGIATVLTRGQFTKLLPELLAGK